MKRLFPLEVCWITREGQVEETVAVKGPQIDVALVPIAILRDDLHSREKEKDFNASSSSF